MSVQLICRDGVTLTVPLVVLKHLSSTVTNMMSDNEREEGTMVIPFDSPAVKVLVAYCWTQQPGTQVAQEPGGTQAVLFSASATTMQGEVQVTVTKAAEGATAGEGAEDAEGAKDAEAPPAPFSSKWLAELHHSSFFPLVTVTDFLDVPKLFLLLRAAFKIMVEGKTRDELKVRLGVEGKLSKEREDCYRMLMPWVFYKVPPPDFTREAYFAGVEKILGREKREAMERKLAAAA